MAIVMLFDAKAVNEMQILSIKQIFFVFFVLSIIYLSYFYYAFSNESPPAMGLITVQGITILRDGRPWIAKGLSIIGRTAPASSTGVGYYRQARENFGIDELRKAQEFGADLIRFQVSQGGLDPGSSIYAPDYIADIRSAVSEARSLGFSVIICVDSQIPSGINETGMPSRKTVRAWNTLAPNFAADKGVMFEVFNEPAPTGPDTVVPYDWSAWKELTQVVVDEIRRLSASNVILVDGLDWGRQLYGAPEIRDKIGQIIYAIHPYYESTLATEAKRDHLFGNFAAIHPVLASEWGASSSQLGSCNKDTPTFAIEMLNYLRSKKIGIVAWAFDYPGTVTLGVGKQVTNYIGFHCGSSTQFGPGDLILNYYKNGTLPKP